MKRFLLWLLCLVVFSSQTIRPRVFRSDGAERTKRAGVTAGGGGGSACPTCLNSLEGYWSFDTQSDGGVDDTSGNAHHADLVDNESRVSGLMSEAIHPTAASSSVGIPASTIMFNGAFAISSWVYIAANASYACVVCEGASEGLYLHASKFSFYSGSDHDSTAGWDANAWTHIVVNYTGTVMTYWINGVEDASYTFAIGGGTFAVQWLTGVSSNSYAITGNQDDTAVWPRILTNEEITALFSSGTGLAKPSW